MASKPASDVKFQCTKINRDFHVGDGRVLLGPRTINKGTAEEEDVEGDVDTIPADVAALGEEKKLGKIIA